VEQTIFYACAFILGPVCEIAFGYLRFGFLELPDKILSGPAQPLNVRYAPTLEHSLTEGKEFGFDFVCCHSPLGGGYKMLRPLSCYSRFGCEALAAS
jgi:hypothetical protein